jgi:hypothetical protein
MALVAILVVFYRAQKNSTIVELQRQIDSTPYRTFKVGEDLYDIPKDETQDFLKIFRDAVEMLFIEDYIKERLAKPNAKRGKIGYINPQGCIPPIMPVRSFRFYVNSSTKPLGGAITPIWSLCSVGGLLRKKRSGKPS